MIHYTLKTFIDNRLKIRLSLLLSIFIFFSLYSQEEDLFNGKTFPVNLINQSIVEKRDLFEKLEFLRMQCDWSKKVGKRVDVFWIQNPEGNFFGHVYEYFMDWYDNVKGKGEILDFMIENLEDDSSFVTSKRKYLKNQKKYKKYLVD